MQRREFGVRRGRDSQGQKPPIPSHHPQDTPIPFKIKQSSDQDQTQLTEEGLDVKTCEIKANLCMSCPGGLGRPLMMQVWD